MSKQAPAALAKPLKLYATGHASLLVGAWAMDATGSMLPMALAASACLLLSVPLVLHFIKPAAIRR
jgi:hypothetical protein